MIARFHCDEETLDRLLHDGLTKDESHVTEHIEACVICQRRMDQISLQDLSWDEVGELLSGNLKALGEKRGVPGADGARPSFLEPPGEPDSIGRFARYEVKKILGRGGMGIVMQAKDTSLGRHCAVKVIAPELAGSGAARKRFSREARSAAAVVHPHVVPIQTVDQHNGLPYLVMPVVEGQSLQQRVDNEGPLSLLQTIRIAVQIAAGLAAAHQKGLIHRDIKPANILLENGVERVQITDFGLARAVDDASMTRSGVIAGTPQYMSPEQAHGDAMDHRSDLFSLGSVIYFMLTGRSPFRAETTMGVLKRIVDDQPRSLQRIASDVPAWLEAIVRKLLSKSPADRFGTAAEIADLLAAWLAHLETPDVHPAPESVIVAESATNTSGGHTRIRRSFLRAAMFGMSLLAGFVIYLQTSRGTLRIESTLDSDIPVIVRRDDEIVQELMVGIDGKTLQVRSGNYLVEVADDDLSYRINDNSVVVERGETVVLTIERDEESKFAAGVTSDKVESADCQHSGDVITGRVLDSNGQAVTGAKVILVSTDDLIDMRREAVTSGNGEFRFDQVSFLRHTSTDPVEAVAKRFELFGCSDQHGLGWHSLENNQSAISMIRRAENGSLAANLSLPDAASYSDRIIDEEGRPIAGATIKLLQIESPGDYNKRKVLLPDLSALPESYRIRQTDRDGRFTFDQLPKGYVAKFSRSADGYIRRHFSVFLDGQTDSNTENTSKLAGREMKRSVPVPVRVVFADTGLAATDVQISAHHNRFGIGGMATTNAEGRAVLQLVPGDNRASLWSRGNPEYQSTKVKHFLVPSESSDAQSPFLWKVMPAGSTEVGPPTPEQEPVKPSAKDPEVKTTPARDITPPVEKDTDAGLPPEQVVGSVLGNPILAKQISGKSRRAIAAMFLSPLHEAYSEKHAEELAVTTDEIKRVEQYLSVELGDAVHPQVTRDLEELAEVEQQLKQPDLSEQAIKDLEQRRRILSERVERPHMAIAKFLLGPWKRARHLYNRFGGGRVLWQQAGCEAFDATKRWLEHEESEGNLVFNSEEVREKVFHYWNREHPGMIDDPKKIQAGFVNPPWMSFPKPENSERSEKANVSSQ